MIVLALRFPDPPVDIRDGRAMNVPLQRSADATPPAQDSR